MTLMMSRPVKHPKTGVYWLRKRVPEDLQPVLGKKEIKQTLGTKEPAEARRRLLVALAQLDQQWTNLRSGPRTLTEREAHELAAPVHDQLLATYRDNPGEQRLWKVALGAGLWSREAFPLRAGFTVSIGGGLAMKGPSYAGRSSSSPFDYEAADILAMQRWCHEQARACLARTGSIVEHESYGRLLRAVTAAAQRACMTLERFATGDFGPEARGTPGSQNAQRGPSVSFASLVEGWVAEKRPAEKTKYEWTRVMCQLRAFVGHDDAAKLTTDDLLRWKTSMVEAGLRPKTIRDAKLAAVRAIIQCAVQNRRLGSNPAEGIVMEVKRRSSEDKRSFNDDEAKAVLRAALQQREPLLRWAPWLCAYTGARISELAQLRAEDILEIEGVWCMRIDPAAGPLKTRSSERVIPLHPALVESGFLSFVQASEAGPLFAHVPPNRFGSRGGNATKVLGRWVRSLGLTDPRLSPNHSWRHRLKTLARRHGLSLDIINAITGHGHKTVADAYGEFEVSSLYRELSKIPALKL